MPTLAKRSHRAMVHLAILTAAGLGGGACGARSNLPSAGAEPDAGAPCVGAACAGGQVVLFGGVSAQVHDLADTWAWNGSTWTEAHPATAPAARDSPAFTALDGVCVLFSGDTTALTNDTWLWQGGAWLSASPAQAPAFRWWSALTTLGGVAVLFGGEGADYTTLADTWTWDGTDWTQAQPATSPPVRRSHVMASLGGTVVLFGGSTSFENPSASLLDDTWTWDGTDWTEQHPAISPPARFASAMATLGGGVVLFGGSGGKDAVLADTWTWDGTAWTEQHPAVSPPARMQHAMATLGSNVVLFGGEDPSSSSLALGDTWTWDGTTWAPASTVSAPPARWAHVMASTPGD